MTKTSNQNVAGTRTAKNNADEKKLLPTDVPNFIAEVNVLMDEIYDFFGFHTLTPTERRRMKGSGIKNYGFIDKTLDISGTNMAYAPRTFNREKLEDAIENIEALRNMLIAVKQLEDRIADELLYYGNEGYRLALIYYNTVRDLARHGDQGAKEVFDELRAYFARPKRKRGEPTETEVERDVRALLKGRKDGKIIIENEAPQTVGGKHVVVDETLKAKAAWKATEEGEIN